MARGVARTVAYVQAAMADGDRMAIVQPAGGGERQGRRQSKYLALLGKCINPELVSRVWADDGDIQLLRQLPGTTCMVDMGVREPDLGEVKVQALDLGEQGLQIAPRINHRSLAGFVAPHDGTVLSEVGDGNR